MDGGMGVGVYGFVALLSRSCPETAEEQPGPWAAPLLLSDRILPTMLSPIRKNQPPPPPFSIHRESHPMYIQSISKHIQIYPGRLPGSARRRRGGPGKQPGYIWISTTPIPTVIRFFRVGYSIWISNLNKDVWRYKRDKPYTSSLIFIISHKCRMNIGVTYKVATKQAVDSRVGK